MNVRYIPYTEYCALWEDAKSRMCLTMPGIPPEMMRMTVQGLSGEGTPFKNEYERLMYKHLNPDMPREITMREVDGDVIIRPERK